MVTFYVVRHGETEANRTGVLQGHLDVPLSEEGHKQADLVAETLRDIRLDAVYTSDLRRASDTARAIMRYHKCPFIADKRLRELNMGLLQGLRQEEISRRFPDFDRAYVSDRYNTRRPGGESPADLDQRASRAMDDIYAWNAGRDGGAIVGIVSHGGTIRSILKKANPDPSLIANVVGNCSVLILRCEDGRWSIVSIGDCGHLPSPDDLERP